MVPCPAVSRSDRCYAGRRSRVRGRPGVRSLVGPSAPHRRACVRGLQRFLDEVTPVLSIGRLPGLELGEPLPRIFANPETDQEVQGGTVSIPRKGACLPPARSRALRAWIDLAPLSDEPLSRPVVRHRCPRCLGEQRWGGRVREYVRRTGDLYFAHQSSTREQENTLVRAALLAYSARKKRKKWSARVHSAAIFLNVFLSKT